MMDDKRISEIDGYKGNDEGFARLYAAIWERALEDELGHQITRLLMDTSSKLFNALLKYDRQDRNTYSKVSRLVGLEYGMQGIRLMQELGVLIDEQRGVIKKAVQAKIYREAQSWPHNTKRRDAGFEKEYLQIRDNILDAVGGRRRG